MKLFSKKVKKWVFPPIDTFRGTVMLSDDSFMLGEGNREESQIVILLSRHILAR